MHIAYTIWALLAAWRWADWNNWREYHTTMLYMPLMNLLYLFFCNDYLLWKIKPEFGLTYTFIEILYTFIIFPTTVLLFLSNYPEGQVNKLFHYLKWIFIYICLEWIGSSFDRIGYSNGWNIGWSFGFLLFMFPMIRLHYKRPFLAYVISVVIIILLLSLFNVPLDGRIGERL
ncbi:CBO0543 family protein [Pseudalkalibacillus decolorationis]|uniref:CBO0543 family protein n=1 Tax=Pseudalkalibacillus decolorationis TaxID=163879 RepID=UPI002147636C|nr:CBO0543 family protein [Pseudalkalibacillus decolorationis]